MNKSGTTFSIRAAKKVTIKPCESTQIGVQIEFELPDGMVSMLVILPTIQTLALKQQNRHLIEGTQTLA